MSSATFEIADGVATLTLSAPGARNAIDVGMADAIVAGLVEVEQRRDVGALLIKGDNGTFCSGANLGSLDTLTTDPALTENYEALERIYRSFTRVNELGVPSVAAVRGAAVGAGLNLALAATVRIVSVDARLISGFVRIGLHPGGGHLQSLAATSSVQTAAAMSLFSEEIGGARAVELGIAWRAVADAEVEDTAAVLAARAARDPDLVRRALASLRGTTALSVPAHVAVQAERSPQMWSLRRKSAEAALRDEAARGEQ